MSKIICEICGTTYLDTEPRCPICGWTQEGFDTLEDFSDVEELLQQEENSNDVPHTSVSRSKNREIFDYDAVNPADSAHASEEHFDDEDDLEEDREQRSNPVLIVFLTIVIVLLLGTIAFILFRYFLPAQNKENETLPSETSQVSETTEETIPTVPCTGLSLTSGMPALNREGQFWLLHVVVTPEDTTDTLTYVSQDESVVTVNEDGRVTAVAEGATTIIVTCGDQRIECPVTVDYSAEETTVPSAETEAQSENGTEDKSADAQETEPAQAEDTSATEAAVSTDPGIVLKLKKTDITFGRSGVYSDLQLDCDLSVEQVEWSSTNPNVATVKNGTVTAVGPGITNITAKYGDQTVICIVRCNF